MKTSAFLVLLLSMFAAASAQAYRRGPSDGSIVLLALPVAPPDEVAPSPEPPVEPDPPPPLDNCRDLLEYLEWLNESKGLLLVLLDQRQADFNQKQAIFDLIMGQMNRKHIAMEELTEQLHRAIERTSDCHRIHGENFVELSNQIEIAMLGIETTEAAAISGCLLSLMPPLTVPGLVACYSGAIVGLALTSLQMDLITSMVPVLDVYLNCMSRAEGIIPGIQEVMRQIQMDINALVIARDEAHAAMNESAELVNNAQSALDHINDRIEAIREQYERDCTSNSAVTP